MKKLDEEIIFSLARSLEKVKDKADEINIALLPKEDILILVEQNDRTKDLLNYILDSG